MSKKFLKEMPVCGFEAVSALSKYHPERISRLFFSDNRVKHFSSICKYMAEKKRIYRIVSDNELQRLSDSLHHQGVVAMIYTPLIPRVDFSQIEIWEKNNSSILVLDKVSNTNNLGAIVRSAAFFGIENIVLTEEDEQAVITTSTYRVAQGGMEFVNLFTVSSTEWFLKQCRGRITSIGTDVKAHHNLSDMPRLIEDNEACAIILGNEEHGISIEAKKLCTYLIKIPGAGNIESLNVAQAAALFCNSLNSAKL